MSVIAPGQQAIAAGRPIGARLLEQLLTVRGVIAVWTIYALGHALMRLSFSRTLSYNDAISSVIAQEFQLGYQKGQPPLWEWMLVAAQQIFGSGIESHLLVRYGAIFAIGIGVYRASLAVSGDVRWSAAISLSVPLVNQLGWQSFEWGTQAIVLAAACLFTLEAALRHVENPNWKSATYLGVATGIGLLSKFSFAMFVVSLMLALALRPASRRGLLHGSTVFAALLAFVITLPYLVWIVQHSVDIAQTVQHRLVRTHEPYALRLFTGLKKMLVQTPAYLVPWPLIVIGMWWAGRREGRTPEPPRLSELIARDITLFAFAVTAAGIIVVGATHFTVGYLHFVLVPLLPYAAGLLARRGPKRGAMLLATIALAWMIALTGARGFALATGRLPANANYGPHWPYAELARALEGRGFAGSTIVTISLRDAGNLHAFLPEAEVLWHDSSPRVVQKKLGRGNQTCVAVWKGRPDRAGEDATTRPAHAQKRKKRNNDATEAVDRLSSFADKPRESIELRWEAALLGRRRTSRWLLVRLDPADPVCR